MNHDLDKMHLPQDKTSFVNHLTQAALSRTRNYFNDLIKEKLKSELSAQGFKFQDDFEFNNFCIKYVEKRIYPDRPEYNELYLKIGTLEVLLFGYSDRVEIDYSELNHFKISATIFRNIQSKKAP